MAIQIKSLDELKIMRQAGLLVAHTLDLMRESIKVGMRTDAIDAIAAANIKRGGATSNFKDITAIRQQFASQSMKK